MKKYPILLTMLVIALAAVSQVQQFDPAKSAVTSAVKVVAANPNVVVDSAAEPVTHINSASNQKVTADPAKNVVINTTMLHNPVSAEKEVAPSPMVVHPSGKEAAHYKTVVHAKHEGPTPVVHPSGKEAEYMATKNSN